MMSLEQSWNNPPAGCRSLAKPPRSSHHQYQPQRQHQSSNRFQWPELERKPLIVVLGACCWHLVPRCQSFSQPRLRPPSPARKGFTRVQRAAQDKTLRGQPTAVHSSSELERERDTRQTGHRTPDEKTRSNSSLFNKFGRRFSIFLPAKTEPAYHLLPPAPDAFSSGVCHRPVERTRGSFGSRP